jgi:hypothetical protein
MSEMQKQLFGTIAALMLVFSLGVATMGVASAGEAGSASAAAHAASSNSEEQGNTGIQAQSSTVSHGSRGSDGASISVSVETTRNGSTSQSSVTTAGDGDSVTTCDVSAEGAEGMSLLEELRDVTDEFGVNLAACVQSADNADINAAVSILVQDLVDVLLGIFGS